MVVVPLHGIGAGLVVGGLILAGISEWAKQREMTGFFLVAAGLGFLLFEIAEAIPGLRA